MGYAYGAKAANTADFTSPTTWPPGYTWPSTGVWPPGWPALGAMSGWTAINVTATSWYGKWLGLGIYGSWTPAGAEAAWALMLTKDASALSAGDRFPGSNMWYCVSVGVVPIAAQMHLSFTMPSAGQGKSGYYLKFSGRQDSVLETEEAHQYEVRKWNGTDFWNDGTATRYMLFTIPPSTGDPTTFYCWIPPADVTTVCNLTIMPTNVTIRPAYYDINSYAPGFNVITGSRLKTSGTGFVTIQLFYSAT